MKFSLRTLWLFCSLLFIPFYSSAKNIELNDIEPSRANIRISKEAENLIAGARDAEKEKKWVIAVKNYQKALQLYGQYVIGAHNIIPNKKTGEEIYYGVQYVCQIALQSLPAEAKELYKGIYESAAQHLFEQSCKTNPITANIELTDIKVLSALAMQYPLTIHGQKALIILIRWYLGEGQIHQAIRYYEYLVGFHPSYATNPAFTEEVLIRKYLNTSSRTKDADDYGNSQLVSAEKPFPNPYAYFEIQLNRNILPASISPYTRNYFPMNIAEPIPFFPIVDGKMLYVSTGSALYVLDLSEIENPITDTNTDKNTLIKIAEKWKYDYSDLETQTFSEERTINTITISNDKKTLYVPLIVSYEKHVKKLGYLDVKYPFLRKILFTFDIHTGKVIWTTDKIFTSSTAQSKSVDPGSDSDQQLKNTLFPLPPFAEDDAVYLAGVNMPEQTDIPEHYLFALNPRNGEVLFQTFVASGILETNLFNNPSREPIVSGVTADNSTIYYCTQMGVIAAVDKHTGLLKWLKKYQEYSIPTTYPDYIPARLPLRWTNNPIIYADVSEAGSSASNNSKGQILVAAIDSPFLFMLSAESGQEIWRWNGDAAQLGYIRYIVGLQENLLLVSSDTKLICLNLKKNGKVEWSLDKEDTKLVGKGAIVNDRVYITTNDSILEIMLKTGKIFNVHPLKTKIKIPVNANIPLKRIVPASGHLLFGNDFLIITSNGQITVYK